MHGHFAEEETPVPATVTGGEAVDWMRGAVTQTQSTLFLLRQRQHQAERWVLVRCLVTATFLEKS